MNDSSGQEFEVRLPESYSDEELISQRTTSVTDDLRLPSFDDYQGLHLLGVTSFNGIYERLDPSHTEALKAITSKYPLIDLGGNRGWPEELLDKFGIQDYTNVDLQNIEITDDQAGSRIKSESMDLLEYMRQIPDGVHANVTSNGVLMADWFAAAHPEQYQTNPRQKHMVALQQEYLRRLFKHIHRVLPEDGVFMANPFDFDYLVQEQGLLVKDESLTGPNSRLAVYRKAPTSAPQLP